MLGLVCKVISTIIFTEGKVLIFVILCEEKRKLNFNPNSKIYLNPNFNPNPKNNRNPNPNHNFHNVEKWNLKKKKL